MNRDLSKNIKGILSSFRVMHLMTFLLFFIFITLILYAIKRGFDYTDEAFYLLNFSKNQEIGISASFFGILLKSFNLSIFELRIIRLLLTITSPIALFIAITKYKDNSNFLYKRHYFYFFFLMLFSSLLNFSYGPQTLSYNTISNNCTIITMALFIIGIYSNSKVRYLLFTLAGITCYITFVGKFTAGFFCFNISLAFLIVFKSRTNKTAWLYLICFILGIVFTEEIIRHYSNYSMIRILNRLFLFSKLGKFSNGSYDSNSILNRQLDILIVTLQMIVLTSILLIPYKRLALKTANVSSITKRYLYFLFGFFLQVYLFGFSIKSLSFDFSLLGISYLNSNIYMGVYTYFFFIFTLVLYLHKINIFNLTKEKVFFGFLLYVSAFGILFGSDNYFLLNIILSAPILMSILYLLYDSNKPFEQKPMQYLLYFTFLIYCILAQSLYVLKPYGARCLLFQDQKSSFSKLNSILIDKESENTLLETNEILLKYGFTTGDYIIGIDGGVLGKIYALGGLLPGAIIFSHKFPQPFLESLKKYGFDKEKKIFFILNQNSVNNQIIKDLSKLGIHFQNAKLLGEVKDDFYGELNKIYMIGLQ